MNPVYLATARLLTDIAPVVFESGVFALKGGTAINLFLRDMPRLSVDLDLVFTDHRLPRAEALAAINEALRTTRDKLAKRGFKVYASTAADMGETKLLITRGDLSVKVEVNTVMRGSVHPTLTRGLTTAASDALLADLELPLLSPEDIYGGKLVAAMDRQHPRDLFDVMELFADGGITPETRRAFVVLPCKPQPNTARSAVPGGERHQAGIRRLVRWHDDGAGDVGSASRNARAAIPRAALGARRQ